MIVYQCKVPACESRGEVWHNWAGFKAHTRIAHGMKLNSVPDPDAKLLAQARRAIAKGLPQKKG